MRNFTGACLLTALLALTGGRQASAQLFGGNTPNVVQFNPALGGTSVTAPTMPQRAGGAMLNFFGKFPGISNQRTFIYTTFPTDSQLPGTDYLKAFGYKQTSFFN